MDKNNSFELYEYKGRARKRGHENITSPWPMPDSINNKAIDDDSHGRSRILGEDGEESIVDEVWQFYSQFSETNLPEEGRYYGDSAAELKINLLIRKFQTFYLESVYPFAFPVPIIQFSHKSRKSRQIPPTKFFLVGDTYGSFSDVVKLIQFFVGELEKGIEDGYNVKIIFLGNIVDRGKWDLHNLLYIMAFNLKYQRNVLILRGNHEEISIAAEYGFGQRVNKYFSEMLFASFCNMFKDLPLIAINHCDQGSFLCLHGGIPILVNSETGNYEVPNLFTYPFNNRHVWIDDMDLVTQQILWNDPILNPSPNSPTKFHESQRGIGYAFGEDIFREFCEKTHVGLIFRGHQVFSEGTRQDFENRLVTIFSASDYLKKKIDARFVEMDSTDIYNYSIRRIGDLSKSKEMKPPFTAYEYEVKDEPFIFASYAHTDNNLVYPILLRLYNNGINIWYDEGIPFSTEWRNKIADALSKCSSFLVFLTQTSVTRPNVIREINYSLNRYDNREISIFPVYLEKFTLPNELKFSMGSIQALMKESWDEDIFYTRLMLQLDSNGKK